MKIENLGFDKVQTFYQLQKTATNLSKEMELQSESSQYSVIKYF